MGLFGARPHHTTQNMLLGYGARGGGEDGVEDGVGGLKFWIVHSKLEGDLNENNSSDNETF